MKKNLVQSVQTKMLDATARFNHFYQTDDGKFLPHKLCNIELSNTASDLSSIVALRQNILLIP